MLHFSWIVCSLICLSLAFLRLYRVHIQMIIGPVDLCGLILEILVIMGGSLALTQHPALSAVTTLRSLNSRHRLIGYTSQVIAYQY